MLPSTGLSLSSLITSLLIAATLYAAQVDKTNLAVRTERYDPGDRIAAFVVGESDQGNIDLNGDGDTFDDVIFVQNVVSDVIRNLGHAISGSPDADGFLVAFVVLENQDGGIDYNADGDTNDAVLHVHDARTGITINVGLAASTPRVGRETVAFRVSESAHFNMDLNGDGDTNDSVLHTYFAPTATVQNLGLATSLLATGDDLVGAIVDEAGQGMDLNGDADMLDGVVHVFDTLSSMLSNLGVASTGSFSVGGDVVAFPVPELGQGVVLNGDGDLNDNVVHVYNRTTQTLANLQRAVPGSPRIASPHVAFTVPEFDQGPVDLNNDGDTNDDVTHVYDSTTGTTQNLQLEAANGVRTSGGLATILVNEAAQNMTDLNNDGDQVDIVLHIHDFSTGVTTNTQLQAGLSDSNRIANGRVAFLVGESQQGGSDLNNDGDTLDYVLHLYDRVSGTSTNIGIAALFPRLTDATIVFAVVEQEENNTDQNGDGDTSDGVLHTYDILSGATTNHSVALESGELMQGANIVACLVSEPDQGGSDLNGDGDSIDTILYLVHDTPNCRTGTVNDAVGDPVDVLFVNGESGSAGAVVVGETDLIWGSILLPPGEGSGRFVIHANLGEPSSATTTALPANVGAVCFPLLLPTASPIAIWNNLGKEALLGMSTYFDGTPIANPPRASTVFLTLFGGDPTNLPTGTTLTLQGAILDPNSTSPKAASATNAVLLIVE